MVIEAGWGLGEAIVGGMITPDTYIFHKIDKNILEASVSEQEIMIVKDNNTTKEVHVLKAKRDKQKLSNKQIQELAGLIMKIENHYGFPVDVEWALKSNQFYILQSRPITTLN